MPGLLDSLTSDHAAALEFGEQSYRLLQAVLVINRAISSIYFGISTVNPLASELLGGVG